MMKIKINLVLVAMVLSTTANAAPDVKEGLWEIKSSTTMQGVPMTMPAMEHVMTECISKESLDPKSLMQQQGCDIATKNGNGNSISWTMKCQQQGMHMTGKGSATYQHTSMKGRFNMDMSGGGAGGLSMKTVLNGRYIGACR